MRYMYKIEKAIGDEHKIWVGTSNADYYDFFIPFLSTTINYRVVDPDAIIYPGRIGKKKIMFLTEPPIKLSNLEYESLITQILIAIREYDWYFLIQITRDGPFLEYFIDYRQRRG
jgi:hypothetical protein